MSTSPARGPRRTWRRGAARRAVAIVASAVVTLLALAVLVAHTALCLLDTEPGRARACRALTELVDLSIEGSLQIGRCVELTPSLIRVERVQLLDPAGHTVAAVRRITVRPDLRALLRGRLRILEVDATGMAVHLTTRGDGRLDLLSAIEPRAPSEGNASDLAAFAIERVRLSDGRIDGLPEGLTIERIAIELAVDFDRHLSVGVGSVSLDVARLGEEIAQLRSTRGTVRLKPGAWSELAATLRFVPTELPSAATPTSGTDHVELHARTRWTEGGPGPIEARAAFALSPAVLVRLGQPEAARVFAAPLSGAVVVTGSLADLSARGELETAGGTARFTGRWQADRLRARVQTDGLELGRIFTAIEHGLVAGDVAVTLGPATTATRERSLDLSIRDGRLDALVVPALTARGSLGADHVRLTSLDVPHLTGPRGRIDVDARLWFDGSAELHLDAVLPGLSQDANVRRIAPTVRGGLRARLRASLTAAGRLDASGRVSLHDAQVSGARVQQLDVEGWARGALTAPAVFLRITGGTLHAAGQSIEHVALALSGGPDRYRLAGRLDLAGRRSVRLDIGALAQSGSFTVNGTATAAGLWSAPLEVSLRDVRIDPARAVTIGALHIAGGGLRIAASGTYRFASASSVDVQVHGLDLARLDRVLGLRQGLAGTAELDLRFRGTLRDPDLTVSVAVSDGHAAGVSIPTAELEAQLDAPGGTLSATSHLRLASSGSIDARLSGTFATRGVLLERLRGGTWAAGLEGHEISPRLAHALSPRAPVLDGEVEVRFAGHGTLEAPRLRLEVSARKLSTTGLPPLAVDAALDITPDHVALTGAAADARGPLVSLTLRSFVTLAQLVATRAPLELLARPWELRVSVPDRRLDALPAPVRVAAPVRVRGDAVIRGGPQPLEADVHLVVVPDQRAVVGDLGCSAGAPSELTVDVSVRDGNTRVTARGAVQGTRVLSAEVTAPTPVDAWVRGGLPVLMPAVHATVRATSLPLGALPGVCRRASGLADLTLEGVGLFTEHASLDLRGTIRALRVGDASHPVGSSDAPASELQLAAALTGAAATLRADLVTAGRRTLVLEARLPVQWEAMRSFPGGLRAPGSLGLLPTLRDEPWTASLRVDHAPIGPLLVLLPGIEQPSGSVHGSLAVRGTGTRWTADGSIALERVSFIVTDPLLRVDDLRGRIRLEPGAIAFEDLSLQDGDGRLRASGRLAFEDASLRSVALRLRTSDYPVRIDGVVFSYIDSVTTIDARLSDTGRSVRVSVRDLAVRLPEQTGRTVQGLDQHPDVVFEDQPGFDRAEELRRDRRAGEPVVSVSEPEDLPLHVTVDAARPFWVRRSDFSVQLTAALKIDRAHALTQISGALLIRRGFLQILGKSFAFERGEIRFDGGLVVDPLLQLRAVHTLASRETVTVAIGGRLRRPELTFSTTVPGVTTEREILELLVRGRGGPASEMARDQAVSALSGLTAGLISSLTRRELGSYLPVLGIESSTGGGTRLHAGLSADRIIPLWLRSVVQGAYVEGVWGTAGQSESGDDAQGGSGSRGGFLIELYLPRDLVTSGTFAEPDNWSIDLSWEP